ncbi:GNAT family N-acetyltransferase [Nocardia sp. BMG51109]|uniref:GNAT family N-acetyltransferase n=1 Tax=Nocardia sp. BMG51109 TaxID=1056816 RepID=UPI001E48F5F8|nr:GNAT family N-acetyltransferase [Nocardia sp. BMG51109]
MSDDLRIKIIDDPFDDPDAGMVLRRVDTENAATYGAADQEPVGKSDFTRPAGLFLLGYDPDGSPVASGAYRLRTDTRPGGVDAEIKRMYVEPDLRGRGYGKRILAELERAAADAGATRAILETGTRSVAAFALYQREGYELIPLFSDAYADSSTNRALGKFLDTADNASGAAGE